MGERVAVPARSDLLGLKALALSVVSRATSCRGVDGVAAALAALSVRGLQSECVGGEADWILAGGKG